MHYVLDACALLAFLRGEEGADKIETLLLDNNNRCMTSRFNHQALSPWPLPDSHQHPLDYSFNNLVAQK